MSAHDDSNELGRRICDALLAAFREHDPSAYCKHAKTMCAFGVAEGPNFAYALHRRRTASLDIYFPSTGTDHFDPFAGIVPSIRATLGTGWADNWAWHFPLQDAATAPDAARFLFRFARPGARGRGTTQVVAVPLEQKGTEGRDLRIKDDHDLATIRESSELPMKRLHNRMTNALLNLTGRTFTVLEGSRPEAQFDALLQHYNAEGEDLLIEVKSSTSVPDVRLAIGQLLDYRRFLERPEQTHLGVLLPEQPPREMNEFIDSINRLVGRRLVTLYWFSSPTGLNEILSSDGPFLRQEGDQR
ncbi:MAG: hypothetical protein K1X67_12410 [Fimbriimonadaceae bacterium]|nr:hypothetical protein [Fimbriimonadaceae bacterium]